MMRVLIVDDHPLIAKAYKETLQVIFENRTEELNVSLCKTIDECLIFMRNDKINDLDLVLLDIRLPPSEHHKILSGEDLGIRIRKSYDCKILISTTFNDNYRVYSILKSVNPDGFLIKNDLTEKELFQAITAILDDQPYYSKTVLELMRKEIHQDYFLDEMDRRILYELSVGTKMKDLPDLVPLSIAGIEKRKRNLKILFNVENEGDRGLILIAKEKGFL